MADVADRPVNASPVRPGARTSPGGGGLAARKRMADVARTQAIRTSPSKRPFQRPQSANLPQGPSSASVKSPARFPDNASNKGRKLPRTPLTGRFNNNPNIESKFKLQLRKYKMDLDDYKKTQQNMEGCYEELMALRDELIKTMDIDPGEVPKPVVVGGAGGDSGKRLTELEEQLENANESIKQMEEEKKKLECDLCAIVKHLKVKEQDLLALDKEMEEELKNFELQEGTISPFQDEQLKAFSEKVKQLQDERTRLVSVNMMTELGREFDAETPCQHDADVTTLMQTVKQLQDELASEREAKAMLEADCFTLKQRLAEEQEAREQNETMNIPEPEPSDIRERLEYVNKILGERNLDDVVKVDFAADNKGLCGQLAQVIGLYEDVARENDELVDKVKEVQGELCRIQRQMEVMAVKESPDTDYNYVRELESKCSDLQIQLSEMEAESEKMKSKISILYHKYKQYKTESVQAKRKLESFEKKTWIKKLINL